MDTAVGRPLNTRTRRLNLPGMIAGTDIPRRCRMDAVDFTCRDFDAGCHGCCPHGSEVKVDGGWIVARIV
jgi:hypothetical protein